MSQNTTEKPRGRRNRFGAILGGIAIVLGTAVLVAGLVTGTATAMSVTLNVLVVGIGVLAVAMHIWAKPKQFDTAAGRGLGIRRLLLVRQKTCRRTVRCVLASPPAPGRHDRFRWIPRRRHQRLPKHPYPASARSR